MKKCILSIVFVLAVLVTISTSAFAGRASETGYNRSYQGSTLCARSYAIANGYDCIDLGDCQGRVRIKSSTGSVLSTGATTKLYYYSSVKATSGWVSDRSNFMADLQMRIHYSLGFNSPWITEAKW
jgi:hypothetical protein